jgi:hypothetical protein
MVYGVPFGNKSIDRFMRGGSFSYDSLKRQLEAADVALVDI